MLHACLLLLASGPAAARRSPRRPNDALEPATPAEVRAVAAAGWDAATALPAAATAEVLGACVAGARAAVLRPASRRRLLRPLAAAAQLQLQ